MTATLLANPLDLVFDKLWDIVERYPNIDTIVKPANRVKFDDLTNRDPRKQQTADADFPLLVLTQTTIVANLISSSTSSEIVAQYSWWVGTGDQRVNFRLNPVKWILYTTLLTACSELTALQWAGKSFVKETRLVSAVDVLQGSVVNEGASVDIEGWANTLTLSVKMIFKRSDITPTLDP